MEAPFITEQLFEIFEKYNSGVFPMQIIIIVLGIVGILLIHSKTKFKNNIIGGFLAFLWLWIGIHVSFFTSINEGAYVFGGLFILQGIFFFIELIRKRLDFSFTGRVREYIGYFFILFGLIIYPIISYLLEGSFIHTISIGLPCPNTIFTFGFLMISDRKLSKYILIIPTIWAIIGIGAAVNFGVYQDYVVLLSAITANIYLIRREKQTR